MHNFTLRTLFLCALGIISADLYAQSNTIALSGTYKQNFDNIGDDANTVLPAGWKADINSANNTVGSYSSAQTTTSRRAGANMNSTNNSGIYNFGAGSTTAGNGDRAVGGVTGSTSNKSINTFLALQNTSATSLNEFTIAYAIEKYRNGSNVGGYSVKLYYSTTGAAGSWTLAPDPLFTTNYAADTNEDGFSTAPNASATRYINAVLTLPSSIGQNAFLYLAWNISSSTGNAGTLSQALGIDDVKIKDVTGVGAGPTFPLYFRSITAGNWSDASTWQSSPDNVNWTTPAGRAPNRNDYTISIVNGHNVHVSSLVSADQLNVDGTLTIDANQQLVLTDGQGFDLNINSGGALVNNGNLLIQSEKTGQSDAGTASVGPVAGTITGSGSVTVERYMGAAYARSAWRMVSAPLSSHPNSAISDKIWNNWQAAGSSASATGTKITGPIVTAANGLDDITPQYSMKWWDPAIDTFQFVTDTKNTSLYSHSGYFLFIRGDRNTATAFGAMAETKLSATGILKVGDVTYPTSTSNNDFNMVGNPYASAIDLLTFNSDNSGSNIKSTYYLWDPYLTGPYGVGGFVTVSIDNLNNVTITPETAGTQGDETRFLQSGQAMYVQTRATGGGGSASVTFKENQKSYNVANHIFRTSGIQVDRLAVNLNVISAGTPIQVDAIVAAFNRNYSSALDDYDAHKLLNAGESISFMRNGINLSIERREGISANDIFNLNLTALKANTTYQLEIKPSFTVAGLNAFLVDNYLKTSTPVDLSKPTIINFTVNGEAASTGSNRFYISFAKPAIMVAGKDGISVFPNPVTNGVINLQMNNMAAGIYNVRVFNSLGQVISTKQINHAAGSNSQTIQMGKGSVKGIYQLEVVKPDNSKFLTKVVAN